MTAMYRAELPQVLGGAVGRIVIDEDGFPVDALEQLIQPFDQRADIVALVEGRDDDRELRPGFRLFSQKCSRLVNCRSGRFAEATSEGPHEPILELAAAADDRCRIPSSSRAKRAVLRSRCQG